MRWPWARSKSVIWVCPQCGQPIEAVHGTGDSPYVTVDPCGHRTNQLIRRRRVEQMTQGPGELR